MYVYITNLAYYNEGVIIGDWFFLGTDTETLNKFLKETVKVDEAHEEYFISDSESETLHYEVNPYCNIYQLNQLVAEFHQRTEEEQAVVNALLDSGIADSLESALETVSDYELIPSIHSPFDVGYYFLEEGFYYEIPDELRFYLDYEAFGQDMLINGDGYLTAYGFLMSA